MPKIRTNNIKLDLEKDSFLLSVDYELIPEEPGSFFDPYVPEEVFIKSFDILEWNGKPLDRLKTRKSKLFLTIIIKTVENNLHKLNPKRLIDLYYKQDEEDYVNYMANLMDYN